MRKNYIEWGHYRGSKKKKNFSIYGEDAYDLWHLGVRFKEILKLRELKKENIKLEKIPRKEKFLILYLFYLLNEPKKIIELGCSAMEIIDGLELCEKFFKNKFKKLFLKRVKFSGIESSKLLRSCSLNAHQGRKLQLLKSAKEYMKKRYNDKNTLLHDFGVSNYAFNSSVEFTNFLNSFGSGYLKVSLSLKKTFSINPRGKKLTFFSIKEMNKLNKPFYFLFNDSKIKNWTILKDDKNLKNRSITGFFYFGQLKNINKIKKKFKAEYFFNKINFKPVRIN